MSVPIKWTQQQQRDLRALFNRLSAANAAAPNHHAGAALIAQVLEDGCAVLYVEPENVEAILASAPTRSSGLPVHSLSERVEIEKRLKGQGAK